MQIKNLALVFVFAGLPMSAAAFRTDLRTEVQSRALLYFLENSHPQTGLTRDRANNFAPDGQDNNVASIAATGFSLAIISHAANAGAIDQDAGLNYCTKTLRFLRDHVGRYKGWFLHFIYWDTGNVAWFTEYSTIDTAILMSGALYAAQIFPDSECSEIAHELYREMDFTAAMTEDGRKPEKRSVNMGFTDKGWYEWNWEGYAEQKLLLLLGLGHPTHPLPLESWNTFSRSPSELPNGEPAMGLGEALFVHQYSELFIDFRGLEDGYANYYENSVRVSRRHREIGQTDSSYKTLREGFWGFSAGEAPNNKYKVYSALNYSSLVCLGCTLGSYMFMPEQMYSDMTAWYASSYRDQIWGRYGFTDGLDLDQDWFSKVVLGITVGPMYMSLVNAGEETSFWRHFMEIPEIKIAMLRARQAGQLVDRQLSGKGQDEFPESPVRRPWPTSTFQKQPRF
jgi:hypothetical protein